MEQPESNPTFCTNNCGFYGSSQFEGMCSKCYRDHVSRSLNPERTNTFPNYYNNNESSASSSSSSSVPTIRDDQDEMVGRMDEDNLPQTSAPTITTTDATATVTPKMDNDDDEIDQPEEQNSESPADPINSSTRAVTGSTMPMTISRNIDIPIKNDSAVSLSVMETSSSMGANSMSPLTASSVDKKKRNRCSWQNCNKKLGLTGFDCRCGGQFCPLHRYANEHDCSFDYKEHGQNEIRKNMPVVQADRVRRI